MEYKSRGNFATASASAEASAAYTGFVTGDVIMVDGNQPRKQPEAMINDTIMGTIAILAVLPLFFAVVDALSPGGVTRRDVLVGGSASVVTIGGLFGPVPPGESPAAAVESNTRRGVIGPIAVLGAGGRTGALCVKSCLDRGLPVRALTRSGSTPERLLSLLGGDDVSDGNRLLTAAPCDVRVAEDLAAGVAGCRGVIYAASASKGGGGPREIDNIGVVSAGEACLKAAIPRYVVISSTTVTRPKSLGYIFTDVTVGGIMGEKRKGEDGVRAAYERIAVPSMGVPSASYTIIRPGGLEEPKRNEVLGPGALEVSQGDTLAGIVSRADLAEVAVEVALSSAPNLRNAAFELYYTDSVQPCEGRFKNLLDNGDIPRLHGDTYDLLFRGLRPDGDYYVPK